MKKGTLEKELLQQRLELRSKLEHLGRRAGAAESRVKLASLCGDSWTANPSATTSSTGDLFHTEDSHQNADRKHNSPNDEKEIKHQESSDWADPRSEQKMPPKQHVKKKRHAESLRAEREGHYSMLTKDNTWQQVGKMDSPLEKPVSRREVLQLQKQFERAMHASQREIRKTRKPGSGMMAEARMEQDIVAIKETVRQLLQPAVETSDDLQGFPHLAQTKKELEEEEKKVLQLRTNAENSQRVMELQSTLATALFEQKWTDLVFGELQAQVTVSCLEQGKLLQKLRNQLATCFGLLCTAHSMTVHDLEEMSERMKFYKRKAVELYQQQSTIRDELEEQHNIERIEYEATVQARYEEYEQKVRNAEASQRRMAETLASLNAIYKKMREDGDVMRTLDLTEACHALEGKLKSAQKELEDLRPLRQFREDLTRQVENLTASNQELNAKVESLEAQLEKREGLVQNLMAKHGKTLSLEELEKEDAFGDVKRASNSNYSDSDESSSEGDSSDESDAAEESDNDDDGIENRTAGDMQLPKEGQEQMTDQDQDSSQAESESKPKKTRMKKKSKLLKKKRSSKKKGRKTGTTKKKVKEEKYIVGKKILTANDTVKVNDGFTETKFGESVAKTIQDGMDPPSNAKTFLCPRCNVALDRAGNIDDQFAEQTKRLACEGYRMLLPNLMGYRPDRPRSWIIRAMRCIIKAKRLADFSADRVGKPRLRFPEFVYLWFSPRPERLHTLRVQEGEEAALLAKAEADENRWALYYGVKKLFSELPEARVFYTFLDEKFGEDDFAFYLHCLTILEAVANEKHASLKWGRNTDASDYDAMRQEEELAGEEEGALEIDDFVFVEIRHAVEAVERVMARASEDDCKRAVKTLVENAVEEEVRITPTTGQRIIDINVCLRVLLQEYRDEQAHRRAALRLMFGCASSGPEEQTSNKTVDLNQLMTIVQTLNSRAGPEKAVSLYRLAHELGGGKVTLDSFSRAANKLNFFTECLRLPPHYGTEAPNHLTPAQCVKLGTTVRQQMALLRPLLMNYFNTLEPRAKLELRRLEEDVEMELNKGRGVTLDGRRALNAIRRLLFFLVGERNAKRELYGEQDENGELTLRNVKRELENTALLLRDFAQDEKEEKLQALQLRNSASLIQQRWRKKQDLAPGVPAKMRKLMSVCFEAGIIVPKSALEKEEEDQEEGSEHGENANTSLEVSKNDPKRRIPRVPLRPLEWVLLVLDEVYRFKIRADAFQIHALSGTDQSRTLVHRLKRISIEEAVHSVALQLMGVRPLAERFIHDFFVNVHKYAAEHPRVKLFARFSGVRTPALLPPRRKSALDPAEEELTNIDIENEVGYGAQNDWSNEPLKKLFPKALESPHAVDTYVAALSLFHHKLYKMKSGVVPSVPLFAPGQSAFIPLELAIAGVKAVFQDPSANGAAKGAPCGSTASSRVVEECMTRIERLKMDKGSVDLDAVLLIVMQGWHSEQILRKKAMFERFADLSAPPQTRSSPVVGINLVVELDEFVRDCVPHLDPSIASNEIICTEMFRGLQDASDPRPRLTVDTVFQHLKETGLCAWAPNRPDVLQVPATRTGTEERWRQLVYTWDPLRPCIRETVEELQRRLLTREGLVFTNEVDRHHQAEYRGLLSRQLDDTLDDFLKIYEELTYANSTTRTLERVEDGWQGLRTFFSTLQKARVQVGVAHEPIRDQFDVDRLLGRVPMNSQKKRKSKK